MATHKRPMAHYAAVRQASAMRKMYARCPDAAKAPPPSSSSVPVVNVGRAASGRYYDHGEVRPECLLWSGDGASDTVGLTWHSWGGPTASADGYGLQYRPQGGRYDALVPTQVRLGDRGYCNGVLSYRREFMRKVHSPTDLRWGRWNNGYPLCARADRHR